MGISGHTTQQILGLSENMVVQHMHETKGSSGINRQMWEGGERKLKPPEMQNSILEINPMQYRLNSRLNPNSWEIW